MGEKHIAIGRSGKQWVACVLARAAVHALAAIP
jgi:hypothetical protein